MNEEKVTDSLDEAVEVPKGVSLRKLEANRRNAQRSTGPKTAAGREIAKRNALKHGLLSKDVVIPVGDGKEDPAEYAALLAELDEAYQPVGRVEELLVEQIATGFWRVRRAVRCETGEIRRRVDTVIWRMAVQQEKEVDEHVGCRHRDALRRTSRGIEHLLDVLDWVRADVRAAGALSSETRELLLDAFDWDDDLGSEGEPAKDQVKHLLRRIEQERKALKALYPQVTANEALEEQAKIASLALPSAAATEKILRYESAIQRQLTQAMNQLERLQQARKGHAVPPPISVAVSQ